MKKSKHGRSLFEFMTVKSSDNEDKITREKLYEKLKNIFGYSEFRPLQLEIIEALSIEGKDCICILPTGAGKSMLYQLPAITFNSGIVIVVSPLIALMKDQVDSLQNKGVAAESLHSEISLSKRNSIIEQVSYPAGPKIRLLFVTPEYLTSEKSSGLISGLVKRNFLKFFAIDESHCISEWGNSFRSSFLKLSILKNTYPNIPIIALTATATPKVRSDIQRILDLKNPKIFVSSFNRPEILLSVIYKDSIIHKGMTIIDHIIDYVKLHKDQCGIIYCRKKEDCDNIALNLQLHKLSAESFHSGLTKSKKMEVQDGFISGKLKVIVCTIAFGMGIDKPDVRYVIHFELSKSLESFSQESGRAARDGKMAESIVYYSIDDSNRISFLINQESQNSSEKIKREMNKKFQSMIDYCISTKICRRKLLLEYFGEIHNNDICNKHCDVCANPKEVQEEFMKKGQSFKIRSLLPPDDMSYEFTNPTLKMRESPQEKKPKYTAQQIANAKLEFECQEVSQRVNIKKGDNVLSILDKLEADERRFNPSFSRSTFSKQGNSNRNKEIRNDGVVGFVPASLLKRKATNQLVPNRKGPLGVNQKK